MRTDNSQGEEYLTDVLGILREAGHRVGASVAADHREIAGINNRVQLSEARRILNDRLLTGAMLSGVTVIDPATHLGRRRPSPSSQDAVVHPGTQLHGSHAPRRGRRGRPQQPAHGHAWSARGPGSTTPSPTAPTSAPTRAWGRTPISVPAPGWARRARSGRTSRRRTPTIGEGTKVPHLSYVGDATIGEYTNIGAASVFVNYDGQDKHHTTVGSHCRTGSDNMFVAPVTVGDGAYTAAGSVITKDVPPGSLAVARGQQRNIEGWVARKRPGSAAAKAAEAASREGASED